MAGLAEGAILKGVEQTMVCNGQVVVVFNPGSGSGMRRDPLMYRNGD